jgi:hypothetical protein
VPKALDDLVTKLKAKGVKNPYAIATAQLQKKGVMKKAKRR